MKKNSKLLLIIIVLILIVGCQKNVDSNEEEKTKEQISSFIKDNMISEWSYEENKLNVDNKLNVSIKLYNINDWSECEMSSARSTIKLLSTKNEVIDRIPSLTFICENNKELVSKVKYENLSEIKPNTISSKETIYDQNSKVITKSAKEEYKNNCKTYKYKEIFRHPEKYINKKIKIKGQVIQVLEPENSEDYWQLEVNMTKDDWGYKDTVTIFLEKSAFDGRVLQDDIITFYGTLIEPAKFDTGESTPCVMAYLADLEK